MKKNSCFMVIALFCVLLSGCKPTSNISSNVSLSSEDSSISESTSCNSNISENEASNNGVSSISENSSISETIASSSIESFDRSNLDGPGIIEHDNYEYENYDQLKEDLLTNFIKDEVKEVYLLEPEKLVNDQTNKSSFVVSVISFNKMIDSIKIFEEFYVNDKNLCIKEDVTSESKSYLTKITCSFYFPLRITSGTISFKLYHSSPIWTMVRCNLVDQCIGYVNFESESLLDNDYIQEYLLRNLKLVK